jgi:6-pyruvoyltetrahydropterin/6-carboxytetrahydropterin synthase
MLTCTKRYIDFPFAHRAPHHDGHCKLIHGHNWSFEIMFIATERDANGFVMDFGKLNDLKAALDGCFDHTLVLNNKDPLIEDFKEFLELHKLDNIRLIPDCSCEGIAEFVHHMADAIVRRQTNERVHVRAVTVYEDSKNSATYRPVVLV